MKLSCHRQTAKAIANVATQMMIRVRSSSRCSTSERRSSCPTGFSFEAIATYRACGKGRWKCASAALVDDLAVHGAALRALAGGQRGRLLAVLVDLPRDGVLELPHAGP